MKTRLSTGTKFNPETVTSQQLLAFQAQTHERIDHNIEDLSIIQDVMTRRFEQEVYINDTLAADIAETRTPLIYEEW